MHYSESCKVRNNMLFYFYKRRIENCGRKEAVNVTKGTILGKYYNYVCVKLVNSKFLPCQQI